MPLRNMPVVTAVLAVYDEYKGVKNVIVRIVSAVIGIAVLVGVLICPYTVVLAAVAAALSAIAVWELLYNTGRVKNLVQVIGGMLFSAAAVMLMYYVRRRLTENLLYVNDEIKQLLLILLALPMVYGVFTAVVYLFSRKTMTVNDACYSYLLTLYPAVGFGCMVMLREMFNHGLWLLILVFLIAWISDTGAYFVGTFLGKHKMAPNISPKKSWEGFFGGWILSVLCAVGLFILRFEVDNGSGEGLFFSLYLYLPVVFLLAPLSVVGDLLASAIKRKCGIKDFGNIMPGHGGVMDRFDSVLFIAPILYLIAVNATNIIYWIAELLS